MHHTLQFCLFKRHLPQSTTSTSTPCLLWFPYTLRMQRWSPALHPRPRHRQNMCKLRFHRRVWHSRRLASNKWQILQLVTSFKKLSKCHILRSLHLSPHLWRLFSYRRKVWMMMLPTKRLQLHPWSALKQSHSRMRRHRRVLSMLSHWTRRIQKPP